MHFQVLNGILFEAVISCVLSAFALIADEIQMISLFVCVGDMFGWHKLYFGWICVLLLS